MLESRTVFVFECHCGCGEHSENLLSNYTKLFEGEEWFKEDHVPSEGWEIARHLAGGAICIEGDF